MFFKCNNFYWGIVLIFKKLMIIGVVAIPFAVQAQKVQCPKPDQAISQSIKWYRHSAESKALYQQIYTAAGNYVEHWVGKNKPKKNSWGVIIDIDETSLDNSWYYEKCLYLSNEQEFDEHVVLPEKSTALPGVVHFTQEVKKLGGYVTMLSNRGGNYKGTLTATVNNLKKQNIAFDQVVLANYSKAPNPTDKNIRFQSVITGKYNPDFMVWDKKLPPHRVIAFLGDNIQDFPKLQQKTISHAPVDEKAFKHFGKGYFLFPNPIYGSWDALPEALVHLSSIDSRYYY
jgi:5'-nucleotidase (lipoprotein e(P4) family)